MTKQQSLMGQQHGCINHIALVIDASDSMRGVAAEMVEVIDQQIRDLAKLSADLDQETRVTVYMFSNDVQCLIYDKDVLRLPSIEDMYRTYDMTALIDATIQAQQELGQTATLYGDHAFLLYVFTDGAENQSKRNVAELQTMLGALPDSWTVACFVPNQAAKFVAIKYGFPPANVAVWTANTAEGVREAGNVLRDSTASYMNARATGLTGTKKLFDMGAEVVNHKTVSASLQPINRVTVLPVKAPAAIRPFIEAKGLPFQQGAYFYPLLKREKVGANKQLVVRHIASGKVYGGPAVRALLGLPEGQDASISPGVNPEYDVFIQSSSQNRKLLKDTDLLMIL